MLPISARLLQRAAELVGGRDVLCHELQVPRVELDRFIAGMRAVPTSLFLKATDLVLEETAALCEASANREPASRAASRAASASGPGRRAPAA
jgi:hypothetical protein